MSTEYTEHIDEAVSQLPTPAAVPADNRTPQSSNVTLEAWNRLQARLVALETVVAKLGKGGFATAVQEDVSALGSAFDTSVSYVLPQAKAYTDNAVGEERNARSQAVADEAARATAAENGKVPKVAEPRRIYATDANGVTTTYPWSVSRTAYNTSGDKNSFVRRNEGRIPGVADPSDNYDAANRKYVDTAVSAKVNKLSGLEIPSVYVGNPNGTQSSIPVSEGAQGSSVPVRDANANISVGAATQVGHAVNLGMVRTLIQEQIGRVYKPAGSITFANLINTVDLDEENLGNIYNIENSFTTTSDFLEGAGANYPEGTNVAVVQVGNNFYFDVLVGATDLSGYAYLEAAYNYFSGSMEIADTLQVYGDLLNINGHTYINTDDQATAAEMAEIFAVLS